MVQKHDQTAFPGSFDLDHDIKPLLLNSYPYRELLLLTVHMLQTKFKRSQTRPTRLYLYSSLNGLDSKDSFLEHSEGIHLAQGHSAFKHLTSTFCLQSVGD